MEYLNRTTHYRQNDHVVVPSEHIRSSLQISTGQMKEVRDQLESEGVIGVSRVERCIVIRYQLPRRQRIRRKRG